MFTGLVQALGTVKDVTVFGRGRKFRIDVGAMAGDIAVGQSVAVNGACLTVTSLAGPEATFDAVTETVSRTNLGLLRGGDKVNLEPALKAGGALDGHMVLGHVDALAPVLAIDAANADNRIIKVDLPKSIRHLVAEKGSVAINGISLTVAAVGDDWFTVAVIPHTWTNSSLSLLQVGTGVNLEADVMARYAARILLFSKDWEPIAQDADRDYGDISENFLKENGFA